MTKVNCPNQQLVRISYKFKRKALARWNDNGINDRDILDHAGKISHEMAKQLAEGEYDKFSKKRISAGNTQLSDFDKAVHRIKSNLDIGDN